MLNFGAKRINTNGRPLMVCLEDAKSMKVEAAAPPTYISEVKQHWHLRLMIAIGLTLTHIQLCTSPITPDCSISQALLVPWVNFVSMCVDVCVCVCVCVCAAATDRER